MRRLLLDVLAVILVSNYILLRVICLFFTLFSAYTLHLLAPLADVFILYFSAVVQAQNLVEPRVLQRLTCSDTCLGPHLQ